jgi:hypothetical protein
MSRGWCKGITQTLIPNTLAVKPKVSQSTDGNLLWSVVYISDTAVRGRMARYLISYQTAEPEGSAATYLLHHVTVTIMVTVTTSTTERMVGSEGKGKEERRKRRKEG